MKFDMFEYETVPDGSADPGGTGEDPGADPAAVVPAEPGAAEPVAATADPAAPGSAPDWENIETLREAAVRLQALGYTVAPQAQPQGDELEYDPYDPNSLLKVIEASPIGQALQHVLRAEEARQSEQVDTQVNEAISTVRTELGFTATDVPDSHIYALGNQIAAEATRGLPDYVIAQRGEQIARDSIKQAVEFFQARDKSRDAAAVEAYKQSLLEGGGNLLDPPIHGAGSESRPVFTDEMDAARNFRFQPA